jgi:hypothetical protein
VLPVRHFLLALVLGDLGRDDLHAATAVPRRLGRISEVLLSLRWWWRVVG